ncbi:MAG: enoyl-CoA hydratase/isomerase family protein [Solirubrobacterales bacterium]|nr:enoyl-CoA hydratase/isomerase family protein [Solirubrobacterales bacterium]
MIESERSGDVTILRMTAGENRFNPENLDALDRSFEEVDRGEGGTAVVLTGEGKFFSNGLDLEWMGAAAEGQPQKVVERVHTLLARTLVSGFPVVAALNGHAFAAGAMLALACDERVMRADRGYFCLPEVDIDIPFTPGMSALIRAKLNTGTAREAMLTGRRYGGEDALEAGIVDAIEGEDEVVPLAIERAAALGSKNRNTVAAIKREMYGPVFDALRLPSPVA